MTIQFLILLASMLGTRASGDLSLNFENLEKTGGTIRLALYDSPKNFMVEEKAVLYNFKAGKDGKLEASLPALPYGTYAFAVFQDLNDNKALGKNKFGIPTEPYAFSKIPPSKWRLPTFDEVKFDIRYPQQSLTVRLEKWKL